MHSSGDNDDEWMLTKDGKTVKVGTKGEDKTDYLYDEYYGPVRDDARILLETADVKHSVVRTGSFRPGGYPVKEGFGYRIHTQFGGHGLYDPSFDIFTTLAGGGAVKSVVSTLARGRFMFQRFIYRPNGQSTFSVKWMNQSKSFMFRFERHNINSPNIGYRTHINLDRFNKGNSHIYLNPKYWKHTKFK